MGKVGLREGIEKLRKVGLGELERDREDTEGEITRREREVMEGWIKRNQRDRENIEGEITRTKREVMGGGSK